MNWPTIHISWPNDGEGVEIFEGGSGCTPQSLPPTHPDIWGFQSGWLQVSTANLSRIDGFGWLGNLDFSGQITGGSPIAFLPVDPVNSVNIPSDPKVDCPDNNDFIYIYTCYAPKLLWEFDAKLESKKYTIDENRGANDGGNNSVRYEVGTDLRILPTEYIEIP